MKLFGREIPPKAKKVAVATATTIAAMGVNTLAQGAESKKEIKLGQDKTVTYNQKNENPSPSDNFEVSAINIKEANEKTPEFKLNLIKDALSNSGNVYINQDLFPGCVVINEGFKKGNNYASLKILVFDLENSNNKNIYEYYIQIPVSQNDTKETIENNLEENGANLLDTPSNPGIIVKSETHENNLPVNAFHILNYITNSGLGVEDAIKIMEKANPDVAKNVIAIIQNSLSGGPTNVQVDGTNFTLNNYSEKEKSDMQNIITRIEKMKGEQGSNYEEEVALN